MSHIARLLQRGIPIISQRAVLPPTPKRLNLSEDEVEQMIPNYIKKEIAHEKRDMAIQKAKMEADPELSRKEEPPKQKLLQMRKEKKISKVEHFQQEMPLMSQVNNVKLSDRIHACLVQLLSSGKLQDPILLAHDLHICRVTLSHSRSKAIVQWGLLGVVDSARIKAIDDAFERHRKQIGHFIGKQVTTRFIPSYLFEYKADPFGP